MLIIILSEYDQKILFRIKLEQEEKDMIEKLIEFTLSQQISKYNSPVF